MRLEAASFALTHGHAWTPIGWGRPSGLSKWACGPAIAMKTADPADTRNWCSGSV